MSVSFNVRMVSAFHNLSSVMDWMTVEQEMMNSIAVSSLALIHSSTVRMDHALLPVWLVMASGIAEMGQMKHSYYATIRCRATNRRRSSVVAIVVQAHNAFPRMTSVTPQPHATRQHIDDHNAVWMGVQWDLATTQEAAVVVWGSDMNVVASMDSDHRQQSLTHATI
jgi:hypothetical protein